MKTALIILRESIIALVLTFWFAYAILGFYNIIEWLRGGPGL